MKWAENYDFFKLIATKLIKFQCMVYFYYEANKNFRLRLN